MNSNNNEINNNENVNIERNNINRNEINNIYRNINNNNNNIQTQKQKISLNFIILSIINLSVYFYGNRHTIEISNTSLCLWPIIYENQYYRFITHFFIHFGLFHLLLELLISFYLFLNAEKFLGSMLVFFYINVSLILISSIYVILMLVTKYVSKLVKYKENFDFMYECGMTPLLLSCFTFYFSFSKKKKKKHQRHEHRRNQRKRRAMVRALRFVFFHAKHVVLRQFGRNHHRVSGVQLFRRCCAAKSRLDSRNRKMPQNQ